MSDGNWYIVNVSSSLLYALTFNTFLTKNQAETLEAAYAAFRENAQAHGILVDDGTKVLLSGGTRPAQMILSVYATGDQPAAAIGAALDSVTGLSVDSITAKQSDHPTLNDLNNKVPPSDDPNANWCVKLLGPTWCETAPILLGVAVVIVAFVYWKRAKK